LQQRQNLDNISGIYSNACSGIVCFVYQSQEHVTVESTCQSKSRNITEVVFFWDPRAGKEWGRPASWAANVSTNKNYKFQARFF